MRYFSLFVIGLALASLILIGTVGSTLVNGVKEKYKAKLLGKNEIPKVKSTAKGSASFKSKKESINWKFNITGISNITGANLYLGNNSLNAEPIVNLMKVSNVSKTSTGLLPRI
jgi:CHRD domain